VIDKPITIKGRPGSILEITHGSIVIDFDKEEKTKEIGIICECEIVFSDRANQIVFKEELDRSDQDVMTPRRTLQVTTPKNRTVLLELSPELAN
jgi:hypothetical protein